jgi:hypothetical protein
MALFPSARSYEMSKLIDPRALKYLANFPGSAAGSGEAGGE